MQISPIDPVERLGEIVDFWNAQLSDRFPLDERLLGQQLAMDRDERLFLSARDDGAAGSALAGIALVKRGPLPAVDSGARRHGYLSFILVDEKLRRRGIGGSLFGAAEAWLREAKIGVLRLCGDRYHLLPGLPLDGASSSLAFQSFVEKRGFSPEGDEYDLRAELDQLDLAALAEHSPLAKGYSVVPYDPTLRPGLESFFYRNFPGRWYRDTMEAIDAGMRVDDLLLLREDESGEIAGFSRIYDGNSPVLGPGVYWRSLMGNAPCGLGPIGVDETRRGLGLGLALLRVSLEELAGRGGRSMVIDWTDLVDFYAKMGFSIWKSYRKYSKGID